MMEKISFLTEILPYVKKFRGTVFVIKLGGSCVANPRALQSVTSSVCMLGSLGIKVVLVHGGGPQADELQNKLGYPVVKIAGKRVTDKNALEVTKMVYAGKINTDVVAAMQKNGSQAVGISGVSAGTICAQKCAVRKVKNEKTGKVEDVDYGYVGDITNVDTRLIGSLMENGLIPVVACLGTDNEGNVFNINADRVAQQISIALRAEKFINVTNVPGLLEDKDREHSIISYLDVAESKKWMSSGKVTEGMIPKLESCIASVEGGVRRAHIIDGNMPNSVLIEVFTNQGCGTMIVNKKDNSGKVQ